MMLRLVHSKSKHCSSASRMRMSLNLSRRILRNQACVPSGNWSGKVSRLTRPSLTAAKVILRRPDRRGELLAEREDAGLESLEGDFAIGEIFVADAVEIVLPDVDRQILAPIIGDALEDDEMARIESADLIGAGAERRLQRRLVEGVSCRNRRRRRSAGRRRSAPLRGCGPCAI